MLRTLPPEEYAGEVLCERCGSDGNGRRFATCAELDPATGERYTHERACRNGQKHEGLCEPCEIAVFGYRRSTGDPRIDGLARLLLDAIGQHGEGVMEERSLRADTPSWENISIDMDFNLAKAVETMLASQWMQAQLAVARAEGLEEGAAAAMAGVDRAIARAARGAR